MYPVTRAISSSVSPARWTITIALAKEKFRRRGHGRERFRHGVRVAPAALKRVAHGRGG